MTSEILFITKGATFRTLPKLLDRGFIEYVYETPLLHISLKKKHVYVWKICSCCMIRVDSNKQEPLFKTLMNRGKWLRKDISNISLKDGKEYFMGKIK